MRGKIIWLLSISIGISGLVSAAGAAVPVSFDHKATPNNSTTELLSVAAGEKIEVTVTNTNTVLFECSVTGIEIVRQPNPRAVLETDTTVCKKEISHDSRFGGYFVKVQPKAAAKAEAIEASGLEARTWILFVDETGWRTDILVGVVGSGLTSPKFFLDTGDDDVKRVFEDPDAEDDLAFGFASFATVYHDEIFKGWGLSLGLGINDNDLSVLFGPSYRLGKRATLTAGYSWGPVDRLPTGLAVGDVFEQDNLSLESATRGDWFFSVSIRGFTDVFRKEDKEIAKQNIPSSDN